MDTNKNSYTIIYATVLVVLVAAVLALVSQSLKSRQQANSDVEKMLSILSSVNLAQESNSAPDKLTYVKEEYKKFITDSYVVNFKGEKTEGDAFRIDLKEEYDIMKQIAIAPEAEQEAKKAELKLPVFICSLPDGKQITILSCYGAGLWGPIWGYLGLNNDYNTVYGAMFGHKSETPGLGAEIATTQFSGQFDGKQVFDNGAFTSIQIVKGGAEPGNLHEVDAISGGTITSKALENTIKMWLEYYLPYLSKENANKDIVAQENSK